MILLLGGGFALADATKQTGLSKYIGHQLVALKDIPIRWKCHQCSFTSIIAIY